MAMSPIERKAKYAYAVTMQGTSKTTAAEEALGVSWTHLSLVLEGVRDGSEDLKQRFADYIGVPYDEAWAAPAEAAA